MSSADRPRRPVPRPPGYRYAPPQAHSRLPPSPCSRAEEEKHKRLTAERKKRDAESVAIGGMLFELTELEAPPIELDEKLWHAVVDHVTVYHDDRLVYSLKDGTEITVEL